MPPSEAGSGASESTQQVFPKEVNSSALAGRKMTASEPKKVITKSKSKSSLEEKQNGSKKTIPKSRTLSTLKEVNNPIINAKNETATKPSKNSTKEENGAAEKKQKKSLAKSKTNKDLKISENSLNNVPVRTLVKSKTLVKYDNVRNSNDNNRETIKTSEADPVVEPPSESNGMKSQKSLTKSKTVAKLKNVNNGGNDEPNKPMRKSRSIAQIVEANEPVSEIIDHKKTTDHSDLLETCDKKYCPTKSRGKAKALTCISEESNLTESNSESKVEELGTNALQNLNLAPRSLAKSRTVAKLKSAKGFNEEGSKSMRKCRSQAHLKADSTEEKVDPIIIDEPDSSLLFKLLTKETTLKDAETFPIPSNLKYATPKSVSTEHRERMKKLAFSDVSIFYFDRTQGYCSIPRDGGNTIGMDMKHSHQEKRRLYEDQEPTVKRKLFNFEQSSNIELNELKKEAESVPTQSIFCENTNSHFDNKPVTQKSSFLVEDDEDYEISFKSSVNKSDAVTATQDLDDTKSPVEQNSNTDPTLGIEIGLFQKACLSSPERVQLDFVPEKNSLDHSPSFKRSLSLSISEDELAFPWRPLRKNSVSFVPPRKTQKPSQHPKTMSSSISSFNLQPHLAYRSSPRLSNIKSTSSLLNEALTTPKTGKICKKNDSLRKSAFRQSQSSGLSKAFSKVDLKLPDVADEKFTGGLPKPGDDLVQSITKNCLRSFRKFSVSPEFKTAKPADIKPEIDEKPKEMVIENVPETPHSNTAPVGRGSNSSSKRSKKKGECGTRGLTPLNSKARFSLLKSYGILNIDKVEAEEIRNIRESREQCGCSCRGDCKPESCECAINGIECQVERLGFPCKCGVGCKNPNGRKVFDEMEVSLHFINTMMNMKGVLDISGSEESNCQNGPVVDKR